MRSLVRDRSGESGTVAHKSTLSELQVTPAGELTSCWHNIGYPSRSNRDISLRHNHGLLQAVETTEFAVNDLRFDFELTDNGDPFAFRIVNCHILSQPHIDQITHGDRGSKVSEL